MPSAWHLRRSNVNVFHTFSGSQSPVAVCKRALSFGLFGVALRRVTLLSRVRVRFPRRGATPLATYRAATVFRPRWRARYHVPYTGLHGTLRPGQVSFHGQQSFPLSIQDIVPSPLGPVVPHERCDLPARIVGCFARVACLSNQNCTGAAVLVGLLRSARYILLRRCRDVYTLERLVGLEPTASDLEGQRSIQLSYNRIGAVPVSPRRLEALSITPMEKSPRPNVEVLKFKRMGGLEQVWR